MDLWHGYVGGDTGFDPSGRLAALDVMVGVREYVADAKRLGLRLAAASSSSRGRSLQSVISPTWVRARFVS